MSEQWPKKEPSRLRSEVRLQERNDHSACYNNGRATTSSSSDLCWQNQEMSSQAEFSLRLGCLFLDKVILPYVTNTSQSLCLPPTQEALAIFDVLAAHQVESVWRKLAEVNRKLVYSSYQLDVQVV